MMTHVINKHATGLVKYFTNSLSVDDYFFDGKSIDGRWHGELVRELGLPERVSKKSFSKLAHNRHPVSGKKLTIRDAANRRASIEFTFSAPKSVSIMAMLSGHREEILHAHRQAVRIPMKAIEADMMTQVRVNGRNSFVKSANIVYARFDHFTARPTKIDDEGVAKFASDPQLHSHCILMNCTQHKGQYRALELSPILRQMPYYESLYHAHFAKALADLGYRIERTKDRWEIKTKGLTRRTIEKFSNRTMQIEKLAKKLGITNGKKKAELGARSRVGKSKVKENGALIDLWRKRLTSIEKRAIAEVKNQPEIPIVEITAKVALDKAMSHHLERKSGVQIKRLIATSLKNGYGTLTLKDVTQNLNARSNILHGKKFYVEYLTTKEMVKAEDKMISFVSSGKNTIAPINQTYEVSREFLNVEQKRAVHHILNSTDRVSFLHGVSGGGKSTLLQEIHEGAKLTGKQVFAFAPSAGASRDILRSKGFKEADTIAAFLNNRSMQSQTKGQIILIDEASLLGVSTMSRIFDVARKQKARVILSGDTRQHNSPEHGDAMRLIIARARPKVAEITKILRQRDNPEYKRAIELLAKGKIKQGFAKLDKMKAVVSIEDMDQRHQKIAKDYLASLIQKRSAMIISPTHAEGMKITEAVRREMRSRGRIHGTGKSFIVHKPLSFTGAQKQDATMYETGQVIQFHQNVKGGFKAGDRYEVEQITDTGQIVLIGDGRRGKIDLPVSAHDRFQVYRREQIEVARGDVIRITKNGRTKEHTRIYNGQVFRVKGFAKDGSIQLSNGKTIDKTYANFSYGYVQTSHAAQGKDCRDVYIAQSSISFVASNSKQFYVSVSRGTSSIKIYTDDKDALRQTITKSGDRISAKEIETRHRERMRKSVRYYRTIINKLYEQGRDKYPKDANSRFTEPLQRRFQDRGKA